MNIQVEYTAPYELTQANSTDSGWDVVAQENLTIPANGYCRIPTGLCVKTHNNLYFDGKKASVDIQLRGRSSLALRGLLAHVGTIDENYNSEISIVLFNHNPHDYGICKGQKVGQLVFGVFLKADMIQVESMEEKRGGFGSSGA